MHNVNLDFFSNIQIRVSLQSISAVMLMHLFLSLDMRKGNCHLSVVNDTCLNPLSLVYRASCCCTTGKAWGEPCEQCPQKGTGKNSYPVLFPLSFIRHRSPLFFLNTAVLLMHFFYYFRGVSSSLPWRNRLCPRSIHSRH